MALAQHLSSHCCDSETSLWSFRGEWGISLELRPCKQQEGPFRMGSDGRGATWRGHAWLAGPWQPSVFARWSIEGPCRPFCHGLLRYRFHAAGPLLYTTMASSLASSTPEQVGLRKVAVQKGPSPFSLSTPFLTFNYLIPAPPVAGRRKELLLASSCCGELLIVLTKAHSGLNERTPTCFTSHIRPLRTGPSVCEHWTRVWSQWGAHFSRVTTEFSRRRGNLYLRSVALETRLYLLLLLHCGRLWTRILFSMKSDIQIASTSNQQNRDCMYRFLG